MLKVCSHQRSGVHLLMALLAGNFDFKENLEEEFHAEGRNWYSGGKKVVVPWGGLFGTHEPCGDSVDGTILYLIRNPLECLRSCWEFDGCKGSLTEFCTDERIKYWHDHTKHYCRNNAFVRYEDLVASPIQTLEKIRLTFNLKRKHLRYKTISTRVGWNPLQRMGARDGYRLSTVDRIRGIIGEEYRGYRI